MGRHSLVGFVVIIGIEPDALQSSEGSQIETWLKSAQGGKGQVLSEHELLWIVREYSKGAFRAVAAATTRMAGGNAEVILVGGNRHKNWLSKLSERIEAWANDEGAAELTARGRRGWIKSLTALGWTDEGCQENITLYRKVL